MKIYSYGYQEQILTLLNKKIIRLGVDQSIQGPAAWIMNFGELQNNTALPEIFLSSGNILIIHADAESVSMCKDRSVLEKLSQSSYMSQIYLLINSPTQKQYILNEFNKLNLSEFGTWEIHTRNEISQHLWKPNNTYEQKRFLYLNRRCSPERLYLFNLLWQNQNFQDQSYTSFHRGTYWKNISTNRLDNHYHVILDEMQQHQMWRVDKSTHTRLKTTIPVDQFPQLPEHLSNQNPYECFSFDKKIKIAYQSTKISIIAESNPQNTKEEFFPTEKTFRAIATKQPFIVFGQQDFYKNLQNLGYQTFNSIWNEDFDSIRCKYNRATKISKLILKLTNMNSQNFDELIEQTKEITEHNYKNLFKRTDTKAILKRLDNLIRPVFKNISYRNT